VYLSGVMYDIVDIKIHILHKRARQGSNSIKTMFSNIFRAQTPNHTNAKRSARSHRVSGPEVPRSNAIWCVRYIEFHPIVTAMLNTVVVCGLFNDAFSLTKDYTASNTRTINE
jgi:hypothetical protein